ncbi:peptidase C39 family protein [Glaciecola sp. 2405UD65-10]|uniref:peptidase C39 family protein n=1 Tax=Glaciecola sp. 2405UD65-10 TaxID=3397244 RepID=UPI003B58D1EE
MSANTAAVKPSFSVEYRSACLADLDALEQLENACFTVDKLSRRQLRHWLKAHNKLIQVAIVNEKIVAYGLVILRKGTSLARLYSLAVLNEVRGNGIAISLILLLEKACIEQNKAYLRLEVSQNNKAAIALYKSLSYKEFGFFEHYYADDSNALRMQKAILQNHNSRRFSPYPYYAQTTEFSCGPASLMMAMAKLQAEVQLNQTTEFDIWRKATTIFMTSGHGGTHPLGLAIAAVEQGFKAQVYLNMPVPIFLAGVRNEHKKDVLSKVEHDFVHKAEQANVITHYEDYSVQTITDALEAGAAVLCLISTYQFDGFKGPHWVAVTHIDSHYMYIHDPDAEATQSQASEESEVAQETLTLQHIPVSLNSFERYTKFGKAGLRTAIVIHR